MIPAYVEKGNRPAEDSSPVRTSEERKRSEGSEEQLRPSASIFRQGEGVGEGALSMGSFRHGYHALR